MDKRYDKKIQEISICVEDKINDRFMKLGELKKIGITQRIIKDLLGKMDVYEGGENI